MDPFFNTALKHNSQILLPIAFPFLTLFLDVTALDRMGRNAAARAATPASLGRRVF